MVSCATVLVHALQLTLKMPEMCEPEAVPGLLPEGTFAIDSLDTVLLCLAQHSDNTDLQQIADTLMEYAESYSLDGQTTTVSVFETTIRIVGGLLGAYDLTCNQKLLKAALRVVDALEPAFAYGNIPAPMVDLKEKRAKGSPWFPQHCTTVADAGTIIFELLWLAERTNITKYSDRAKSIMGALGKETFIAYQPEIPCSKSTHASIFQSGGGGDSWFEVLLKLDLRPELTRAFLSTVNWAHLNPSHLECVWPIYTRDAQHVKDACIGMATSQCHRAPEAAEMMFLLGDIDLLNRAKLTFLKECKTPTGYGSDSWIVAETIKYLFRLPPENAILSTEAHARLKTVSCPSYRV